MFLIHDIPMWIEVYCFSSLVIIFIRTVPLDGNGPLSKPGSPIDRSFGLHCPFIINYFVAKVSIWIEYLLLYLILESVYIQPKHLLLAHLWVMCHRMAGFSHG